MSLFQKMIKQRQESAELYDKGGRARAGCGGARRDRDHHRLSAEADVGRREAAAIDAAIQEINAATMKDMGKVIGALRGKYAGQMDIAKASAAVKAKLAG